MFKAAFFYSVHPKQRTQRKDRIWSLCSLHSVKHSSGWRRQTCKHTSHAFIVFLVFIGIGEQKNPCKGWLPSVESALTLCTDSQVLCCVRTWNAPKFLYLGLKVWGLPLAEVSLKSRVQTRTKETETQARKRSNLFSF